MSYTPNKIGSVYCARGDKFSKKELDNSKPLGHYTFLHPIKVFHMRRINHFPFQQTSKALWPSQQKKTIKRKKETQGVHPYRLTVS
jgi:hypothetical protein